MAIKEYKKGSPEQLSKNFVSTEFDCKCSGSHCKTTLIDSELIEDLQKIRDHFGKPVNINSGFRCAVHNAMVGGAAGSKHCTGKAADIAVDGVDPEEVAKYAESIGVLGIGLYDTDADGHFVHIDTRTSRSFWLGHKQEKRTTFGGAVEKPVKNVEILPLLRKGCKGATVKAMQILLIGYGYGCGKYGADGDFGANTDTALRNFQRKYKLEIDGICGEKTWAKLLGM